MKTAIALLSLVTMPALAQVLQPVVVADGGTNWTLIAIGVLIAVTVVGFVYLKREDPTAAATVSTDAKAFYASAVAELTKIRTALESTASATVAAAPAPVAGAAPAVIGKNGAPGTFTITVTGVPAADMAAINAQYFA